MPREIDSASRASPNAIPVYMQLSRGIVGKSVNIVRRRESSRMGFCRPCRRARAYDSCNEVNVNPAAVACISCRGRRKPIGAHADRLALWCSKCTAQEERCMQLCRSCLTRKCEHCSTFIGDEAGCTSHTCSHGSCQQHFYVCALCRPLRFAAARLQCTACWHARGQTCIVCNQQRARNDNEFYRACRPCFAKRRCDGCNAMALAISPRICFACGEATALWCTSCCTDLELQSCLCKSCFARESASCGYCWNLLGACDSAWHPCSVDGCTRYSFHCGACVEAAAPEKLRCRTCWNRAGGMCIACGKAKAQNARQYMHRCRPCVAAVPADAHFRLVRSESVAYIEQISQQQVWSGDDPALQLLLLPDSSSPLPLYGGTPDYLSPFHCHLCLQPLLPSQLECHLREAHNLRTVQAYRQHVCRRAIAAWPEAVMPQLLRCRLAAFKDELSNCTFSLLPCAVCARQKRACKLRVVQLPPPTSAHPPTWLPWDCSSWQSHRETWYNQVHELLNIENYLMRFFLIQDRLEDARRDILAFEDPAHVVPGAQQFTSLSQAQAWHARVKSYVDNLRATLTADSVAAPGSNGARWLLYPQSIVHTHAENGTITCRLCRRCYDAFRTTHGKLAKPAATMPSEARANGLWR